MHIFYTPDIQEHEYTLNESESKHAIRVLRLEEGDKVKLIDGKGTLYEAVIAVPHPKRCQLVVLNSTQEFEKPPFQLHIAIAPTKNIARFEWFLEKATEIGISRITPLLCDNSERKAIKPERLEKVLVAAMKQSIKAYKPSLDPLTAFKDFLKNVPENACIAHCEDGNKELLKTFCQPSQNITIMIGPEGDFSPNEIEKALSKGIKAVSLGSARLRTETAGVVACHTCNLINQ